MMSIYIHCDIDVQDVTILQRQLTSDNRTTAASSVGDAWESSGAGLHGNIGGPLPGSGANSSLLPGHIPGTC
eukprot:1433581-Amphidinium_carterae.1